MKFLVLGCNGMAGHMISLYLSEQGHNVVGFAREYSPFVKTIIGDVTNENLLRNTIETNSFDVVINCVGLLNQFAEDNHACAVYINSYLPHLLVDITQNMKTWIIHMSTDCVFSGKRGNYTEKDFKDGTTFYDRTKALGEIEDDKNLTLRQSIIGPDIKSNGIGLLNWFLQQNGNVNGFAKAMWTGQTTLQLAKTMEYAAQQHMHGLYNMVPNENISKYDLLCLFNKYLRKDKININKIDGIVADKTLIRTNYENNLEIPDYETMILELAVWMQLHREFYPHYNLM